MSSILENLQHTEEAQQHRRDSFPHQKDRTPSLTGDANEVGDRNGQTRKSPSPRPTHRRGYQACDPCRKRKVKCDLGSVDNPRPPPCVRCRRESKRCEFSATRRKRKRRTSDADSDADADGTLRRDKCMMVGEPNHMKSSPGSDSPYQHTPSISFDGDHSSRTTQWPDASPPLSQTARPSTAIPSFPPSNATTSSGQYTELGSVHNSAIHARMHGRLVGSGYLDSNQQVINKAAAELLSPSISNTNDALHLLSEAAGRTEDLNRQSLENRRMIARRASSFHTPPTPQGGAAQNGRPSFRKPFHSTQADAYFHPNGSAVADPDLSDDQSLGYLDAVKAWSRLRFVRAGWLTVEEAMAYIDYYYKYLAPLSPIVIPDFSPPSTHRTLLTEEPVLAVTMLTTASRYMRPRGDGAHSRAFYIHDRLWSYLRGMIERLFWGQEKFGGNPMGSSSYGSIDMPSLQGKVNPSGQLRSLGTIEALLILTDWQPRNLHFPPGDDENTLLDADAHVPAHLRSDRDGDNDLDISATRPQGHQPEGRLAFQRWLEPTWRSDRMSWMLLSTAQALAFELGVFDEKNSSSGHLELGAEQVRKRRVRRLILVYVTQSSGRLGIPSMLPFPQWSSDTDPTPFSNSMTNDVTIDRMQDCWISISEIMYQSNQLLFCSKEQTSELIRTGRYRERIADFIPLLRNFRRKFDNLPLSPQMRMILSIEYEYTRLYVNCLALQAVVDRWTTINNDSNSMQASGPKASTSLGVLMELYRVNEIYIREVVDASRNILKTVLEGLLPGDHLKHCPVRTYFRVLSGMIFILKTFTLGATEDDVRVSLDLQDRTIEALRTCVVDDVHLGNTISRLLELLTTNIRTRFLRFAPTDRAGDGDGQERPSAPNSHAGSPRPREKGTDRREPTAGNSWPHSHSSTPFPQQPNSHGHLGYSLDGTSNGNHPPETTMGGYYDPLPHIRAQPINSSTINVAFMPPPPSVYYNYYDHNTTPPITMSTSDDTKPLVTAAHSVNDSGVANSSSNGGPLPPDWFALPLDQFFNSSTGGVEQGLGGTGPMVGEFDMLEVLLDEHFDRDDGNTHVDASSHFIGV